MSTLPSHALADAGIKIPALVARVFAAADIRINGSRPWDMQVHNPDTFARIAAQRSLGLGESYMDGWWECATLDQFFFRLMTHGAAELARSPRMQVLQLLSHALINRQNHRRAWQVAKTHYDAGNDLFEAMLDETLAYSCGYWKNADGLSQAQREKLDLICRKLQLQPGMRVLDIGCGWGSFVEYAARHYQAEVTGITVSVEQARLAQSRCRDLSAEILVQDYRDVVGRFDRVVSVGMFEHVGRRNYRTFMDVVNRHLEDNGLFLLHTIGANRSQHTHDPWINRYIFPNGELPSLHQLSGAAEKHFIIEDVHNFGPDYATTLNAWHDKLAPHWGSLAERYDERFQRMWRYYLKVCAAAFQARRIQLWQVVMSKPQACRPRYDAPRP